MALKDWRKDSNFNSKHQIVFRKGNKAIEVSKWESIIDSRKDEWNVNKITASGHYSQIKNCKFKSQALKFAKSYMRTH